MKNKNLIILFISMFGMTCDFIESAGEKLDEQSLNNQLFIAIKNGRTEDVSNLIQQSADVNGRDVTEKTPLLVAVNGTKNKIVEILVDAGADTNLTDFVGQTPLSIVIAQHKKIMLGILLDSKATNINLPLKNGDTPLHTAAKHNNEDAVKELIEAGAHINERNNENKTPYDIAQEKNNRDIMKILADAGAEITIIPGVYDKLSKKAAAAFDHTSSGAAAAFDYAKNNAKYTYNAIAPTIELAVKNSPIIAEKASRYAKAAASITAEGAEYLYEKMPSFNDMNNLYEHYYPTSPPVNNQNFRRESSADDNEDDEEFFDTHVAYKPSQEDLDDIEHEIINNESIAAAKYILGITTDNDDVTKLEIRRAYKQLALLCHPDKQSDLRIGSLEVNFQMLGSAKDLLLEYIKA